MLSNFLFGFPFLKIATLIGLSLYLVFAFVIVRQVTHMTSTLRVGFEKPILFLAWVHLIGTLALIFLALTLL